MSLKHATFIVSSDTYSTLSQLVKVSTYSVRVNATSPSGSSTGRALQPTVSSSSGSASFPIVSSSVAAPIKSSSGVNEGSHVVGSMLSFGIVMLATSLLFV
jgi:hypothetical protein